MAFVAPSPTAVKFAIKTLLGGGLALWLAMRFSLEQPVWAMMTAFIVSQPMSGMVVQKGLARLLGTLTGTVVSLILMSQFAQAPALFLLSTGVWFAICTGASTMIRSAWSYSFILSGYTVAIITLPIVEQPMLVFDEAIARCTEICIGILCATAVSALLWPQRVETQMVNQARAIWQAGIKAACRTLSGEPLPREGLLDVLGRLVAVDAQREHAWFEGQSGRNRALAMSTLSRDLLAVLRLARGTARQWQQLTSGEAHEVAPWIERVSDQLQAGEHKDLSELAVTLRTAAAATTLSTAQQLFLERLALVVLRVNAASRSLLAVDLAEAPRNASGSMSWHRDWMTASVFGARSAMAFLGLSIFWLATGWTSAPGALILTCVVCSLFASRENAPELGMLFMRGILYAVPVAFIVSQVILPQVTGFAMLCLVMGVPLFIGTLGMSNPLVGATATSFCMQFIVLCAPRNPMNYDVAFFLNEALAMIVGVGFAVWTFKLIGLRYPRWRIRRLMRATLQDLRQMTRMTLGGAESWFGGRMTDRLLQLAQHYTGLRPSQARKSWADGMAALDFGDELLHLRACLAAGGVALGQVEERFLSTLRFLLRQGPSGDLEHALDDVAVDLMEALVAAPASVDQRLAQAALVQLQDGWRHWCALRGGRNGTA